MPVGEEIRGEPGDENLGALAAALTGLESDLRVVTARVQNALRRFEAQFADDPEGYELAREQTGAAALYDAAVRLAAALDEAVSLSTRADRRRFQNENLTAGVHGEHRGS